MVSKVQETGERLARIETNVEHIMDAQEALSVEQVSQKRENDVNFRDLKDSVYQLRVAAEVQHKTLEAAHQRIDLVDQRLQGMETKVDALDEDFNSFKQRITFIISAGATLVTIFWAVAGPTVQKFIGMLFGG